MKVCLFDCGGVLYPYSLSFFKEWLTAHKQKEPKSLKWKELMMGEISFSSFSKDVCDQIGVAYTLTTQEKIKTALINGKKDFYLETMVLMSFLKEKNIQMGLLSNAIPLFEGTLQNLPLSEELMFPSYQMGLLKPDKKIFDAVLKKINVNPCDVLFIDDKKENVEAAVSCGMKGIVFQRETVLSQVKKILGGQDVRSFRNRRCYSR